MAKTNKKLLEEIIRVDHAGERGAIKIYEGQLLALKTFKQNEYLKKKIEGKNVVCILSGGNNDISRYPVIMEKALFYQDLKHYFIVSFHRLCISSFSHFFHFFIISLFHYFHSSIMRFSFSPQEPILRRQTCPLPLPEV